MTGSVAVSFDFPIVLAELCIRDVEPVQGSSKNSCLEHVAMMTVLIMCFRTSCLPQSLFHRSQNPIRRGLAWPESSSPTTRFRRSKLRTESLMPLVHELTGAQAKSVETLIPVVAEADAVITQFAPVTADVIAAMKKALGDRAIRHRGRQCRPRRGAIRRNSGMQRARLLHRRSRRPHTGLHSVGDTASDSERSSHSRRQVGSRRRLISFAHCVTIRSASLASAGSGESRRTAESVQGPLPSLRSDGLPGGDSRRRM